MSADTRPELNPVNNVRLQDGTTVTWDKANPRDYWTPEFWAAARPAEARS